jgi:hypothetical protein
VLTNAGLLFFTIILSSTDDWGLGRIHFDYLDCVL